MRMDTKTASYEKTVHKRVQSMQWQDMNEWSANS